MVETVTYAMPFISGLTRHNALHLTEIQIKNLSRYSHSLASPVIGRAHAYLAADRDATSLFS